MPKPNQTKQSEWLEQWSMFDDNELFLFKDWIQPYTLDVFRDCDVLECGCGQGLPGGLVARSLGTFTSLYLLSLQSLHRSTDLRGASVVRRRSEIELDIQPRSLAQY